MRLKTKHALPFLLSLRIIRITGTKAKVLNRKTSPRKYRNMEGSGSSAAPLEREQVEARGREKSQRGKSDPAFGATTTFLPVW